MTPRYSTVSLKSLGQRRELSSLDTEKVNAYYSCDSRSASYGSGKPGNQVGFLNYHKYGEDEPVIRRTTSTTTTTTEPPPPTINPSYLRPKRLPVSLKMADRRSLNPCDEVFETNAMFTASDGSLYIFSGKFADILAAGKVFYENAMEHG